MTIKQAAVYLRSSKDRHAVSIDSQRRKLAELADKRGLTIVKEYADAVESGASVNRPAFQQLYKDLKLRPGQRGWDTVLILDTSRLGRRRWIGPIFKHECRRSGVEVIYHSMPDIDPIHGMMLESILQAMDEMHSLVSREKGIAGQVENIKQGWRAGGRAPIGYRLQTIETGAMREGAPVTKTKLIPNEHAPVVKRYLQLRAGGMNRRQAMRETKIQISQSGAVSLDWHALTYAGHTVYGMYSKHYAGGPDKKGRKRLPRDRWLINRNTHEALITEKEAVLIIERLEQSKVGKSISDAKLNGSAYLFTGLLVSPDGEKWTGSYSGHTTARRYRLRATPERRGRYFACCSVDEAVMAKIAEDFGRCDFAADLITNAATFYDTELDADFDRARDALKAIDNRIDRLVEMAEGLDNPEPVFKKINEIERSRPALRDEVERLEQSLESRKRVEKLDPADVTALLNERFDEIRKTTRAERKQALRDLIEKITLCPATGRCRIHYRIQQRRSQLMASHRGFEPLSPP